MQERFFVGEIVKPQGILGEVKVKPYTDDVRRFSLWKEIFVEDEPRKILGVRGTPDFVFLALSGVADRNAAELLRGKKLYVLREQQTPLKKDTYYIVDVLGSEVFDETGKNYGRVTDITQASRDIYTLKTAEGKVSRFPFLKDLVRSVDPENKRIEVWEKRMDEVLCHED